MQKEGKEMFYTWNKLQDGRCDILNSMFSWSSLDIVFLRAIQSNDIYNLKITVKWEHMQAYTAVYILWVGVYGRG